MSIKRRNRKTREEREREQDAETLKMLNERRVTTSMSQVLYIKRSNKMPQKIYDSQAPYIFLQYIRLVTRWGHKKLGISKRRLELLLYLYPIGVFNKYQFNVMCRTVELNQNGVFKSLYNQGLLSLWRRGDAKKKTSHLYCLSAKAKNVISRMHRMCLGEEKIPMNYNNPLKGSELAIDKYYLEMMKKMNKEVDKKKRAERDSNPRE